LTTLININTGKSYDAYIGRGSKWGNPYHIGMHGTREEVIEKYKQYILSNKELIDALPELKDKILGCYCKPFKCHGDILIELIDKIN